ncbi:17408_t:CDS:2, partial [Racocetra fulgida]
DAHRTFYYVLDNINKDPCTPQEVRDIVQNLLKSKKRREDPATMDTSSKKPCVRPEISCFCPNTEIPLQADGSVDILEIV